MRLRSLAFIGFGEVGQILAKGLLATEIGELHVWDIAFADAASPQARAAREVGVRLAKSATDAVMDQEVVLSMVTAGAAEAAARSVVPALKPGATYADLNSVSPGTKRSVGRIIESAGGCFVEAAVMIPIQPRGLASPMLLGGPHGERFAEMMRSLGMDLTPFSETIGSASAVKMCRSVVVKGLETLLLESLVSARHYGVENEVMASLSNMIEGDWQKISRYMMSRALIHGRRRAEELREVAKTVSEAQLEPHMSAAAAQRQDWAADQSTLLGLPDWNTTDLEELLTRLRGLIDDPSGAGDQTAAE